MQLFNQLKWYFKREWKRYFSAVILLIIIAILQLIPPKIIGALIDFITKKNIHNHQILPWICVIILVSITVYFLRYLWRILLFGAAYKLAIELRVKFYSYLSKQKPTFFLQNKIGDLIARATNDVDRVVFAAGEGVVTLVDSLVMSILVITIMIHQISFILTIISLIPMPIMAFLIKKYGNQLHETFSRSQHAFSLLNNTTQETLINIRIIKSFGLEKKILKKFYTSVEYTGKKNMEVAIIDAHFDPVIYIAVAFSNLFAVVGGSFLVWNQTITIGQLTSFIMYLGLMIWPMLALAWMLNIVERGSAAWNRISDIIKTKQHIKNQYISISDQSCILNIKINYFSYPSNKNYALKNIYITLNPGKILGICGPTGSGKSTILKIIQYQFHINQGDIFYNSISLSKFNINHWRNKIAVVNQNIFLFSDTIAKNIALGKPHATQEDIEKAAKLADLHKDILNFSQGYQTQVGERGLTLSGGQKQRLSIARALLLNKEILILDDVLSSVDGKTEHNILKNIYTWKKNGRTLIMTAHRLSTLIDADEIIVLKHGSIIQRGNHNALNQEENWYKSTYKYQNFKIKSIKK